MPSPMEDLQTVERAKVMLLGVFHFHNPGLDFVKQQHGFDALSPQRQAEIEEVVRLLGEFRPTKVVVENRLEHAGKLQERYDAYRQGAFALQANEIYQLGFRLAAAAGHDRVYPIDEWGRHYISWEELGDYARKRFGLQDAQLSEAELDELFYRLMGKGWMERCTRLGQYDDQHLREHTLREHLLYQNSPERIRAGHEIYLTWLDGEPGDYTMVDHISGWWYNRNLRIFANLKRITESPEDRLLVIYGSGHLPILRHAVEHSPIHELVEVDAHLA